MKWCFCNNVYGLRDYLMKSEKDKYGITYMQNLKKSDTNELIYKTERDAQTLKTNLWLPKGKDGGKINQEFGINIYILPQIKYIINEDSLQHRELYSIFCKNLYGKKNLKKNGYMSMYN